MAFANSEQLKRVVTGMWYTGFRNPKFVQASKDLNKHVNKCDVWFVQETSAPAKKTLSNVLNFIHYIEINLFDQ